MGKNQVIDIESSGDSAARDGSTSGGILRLASGVLCRGLLTVRDPSQKSAMKNTRECAFRLQDWVLSRTIFAHIDYI